MTAPARPRRGRPPLPRARRRSALLVVRVTNEEAATLARTAERLACTVADVVRASLGLPRVEPRG